MKSHMYLFLNLYMTVLLNEQFGLEDSFRDREN